MESEDTTRQTTTPQDPTHEASSPPSSPEPDRRAVEEGEDKLEQAGGGH
jgi:hypothetical protein